MKKIFKNKKALLSLGILVPSVTFSIVSLSTNLNHYNNTIAEKNRQSLNKAFASMDLQSKKSLLISDYFGNDPNKQKEHFIAKFKEYWTNNFNLIKKSFSRDKYNINDIFSWIDFKNVKVIKETKNDSFYKLFTFQLDIKNSSSKISTNFCFYQSMEKKPSEQRKLLTKIKGELISKEGIYKLSSFNKIKYKKNVVPLIDKIKQLNQNNKPTTPKNDGEIKKELAVMAKDFNEKQTNKLGECSNPEHHFLNYKRVYFKNGIAVFLNASIGKFTIYDHFNKKELRGATLIDDFDGGESKHFKILNNNLFYTSEKGDTEYLNYIDLSTQNTIQNPHLEIYQDYNMEIDPFYSGNDEVVLIYHNSKRGSTKRIVFDIKKERIIFDVTNHASDALLFYITQDKKTFFVNTKYNGTNGYWKTLNSNSVFMHVWNGQKYEVKKYGTGSTATLNPINDFIYRIRKFEIYKNAYINNKLVKNVSVSLLEGFSNYARIILIMYEENGKICLNKLSIAKNAFGQWRNDWFGKGEAFYKTDATKLMYKNKNFIYILNGAARTPRKTINNISNAFALEEAKLELVNNICDAIINYQVNFQTLLYDKYFILYKDVLSKFKNTLTYIKIKIDKEKIKEMIADSINNFDFTSNPIYILSHKSYKITLNLNKLKNFMSFIYRDIAGNESESMELEFDNKDVKGAPQDKYVLTLQGN